MTGNRLNERNEDVETEDARISQVEVVDDRALIFAFSNGVSVKINSSKIRDFVLQSADEVVGPEESMLDDSEE